jgi:hypothetical protein
MSDTDQKKEDEVLRRMLATKPKPHKQSGADAGSSKKRAKVVKNDRVAND